MVIAIGGFLFWLISLVYSSFAFYLVWGWFVVPFGIMPISLPWALGLCCLAGLLRGGNFKAFDRNENPFFSLLMINVGTTGYIVIGYIAHKLGAAVAIVAATTL